MMTDVSIIVVSWNVKDLVNDCLSSVYKETKDISFEIIYVDNGSVDGTVTMVRSEFPGVKIIENKENLGFIKASNQGIRIAMGRYILLLNSDTLILDNAIGRAVKFADTQPRPAVVGGKVLCSDGKTLQNSVFRFYSTLNMIFHAFYFAQLFPDNRLLGRKKYTGWKVLYTPEPRIIHFGEGTTKKSLDSYITFQYQLYGARLTNVKLFFSPLTFFLCRLLTACFFFFRIPLWLVYELLHKSDKKKAYLKAKAYLQGSYYAIFNWMKLVMNKKEVRRRLYGSDILK